MEIPLYHFAKDDDSSIPFKVIPLRQRSDYNIEVPHRHNYYEIFFFEKGGGEHTIDFQDLGVEDFSIHFVSPGQVHRLQRANDSFGSIILFSREFYYLGLQEKNLLFDMPFLNNAVRRPVLNLQPKEFHHCFGFLKSMEQEAASAQSDADHQIRSYLNIMMVSCKRLFQAGRHEGEVVISHPLFNRFRQAVEENFAEKHQARDYASFLGVSDKQLSEVVREQTGKTVLEYIHSRLLLEARRLLRHSELSLKEIAFFLHFEDPSHFSRFFKAKMECSPSDYRQQGVEIYQ